METIGFSADDIVSIFQILSAVLKLGNLQFIPRANIDGTEGCALLNQYGGQWYWYEWQYPTKTVIYTVEELYDVSELLLSDMSALETAFTQRIIETRHELLVADLCSVEVCYLYWTV